MYIKQMATDINYGDIDHLQNLNGVTISVY